MSVTFDSVGTWARIVADGTVAIPAGAGTGDLMILLASWKDFAITAQVTTPTGWTEITEFADGSVNSGVGVGSVKVAAWWKEHDGSESDPTLDYSANPTEGHAVVIVFARSLGSWVAPTFTTAAIAAATNWTATGAADLSLAGGDALLCLVGFRDDSATMTRSATNLTATGITWTADYVESPATHFSSTTGQDMSGDAGYRLASSGTSSAAPTAAGTLAASETGAALFIRLRDSAGGPVTLDGSFAAISGSSSALQATRPMAATEAAISGSLSQTLVARALSAGLAAISGSVASVAASRPVAGALAALSGSAADLTVGAAPVLLEGQASAVSGSLSALARARSISASVAAVAALTSSLNRQRELASGALAISGSAALAIVARSFGAPTVAISDGIGSLIRTRLFAGPAASLSGSLAELTVGELIELAGLTIALSGSLAELTVGEYVGPDVVQEWLAFGPSLASMQAQAPVAQAVAYPPVVAVSVPPPGGGGP